MSVSALLGLASVSRLTSSADDDWVDRINHLYTVIILILFAVFVTGNQFVGNPIDCWTPAHFSGAYVSYTKSYCWVKNTYYIPMHSEIPTDPGARGAEELTYYQWVPIILMFMAVLFKLPCFLWRMFNKSSAINLDKIVSMTTSTQIGSPTKRNETISHIAVYIDRWLEARRQYNSKNILVRIKRRLAGLICFPFGKREGTYLTGLYIFIKLLYVVNVIAQFFILNAFMGHWYNLYGFEVLGGLLNDHGWGESYRFPKVTLCDFDIRQLNNIQRYTVQCVLPINLFNEKIFIFLWFWFCGVAIMTTGNFLFWVWRTFIQRNRTGYIKKYLTILGEDMTDEGMKYFKRFALDYLRDDGIFVLRLVAKNSNDILLSDLIAELWKIYKNKPLIKMTSNGDNDHSESVARSETASITMSSSQLGQRSMHT